MSQLRREVSHSVLLHSSPDPSGGWSLSHPLPLGSSPSGPTTRAGPTLPAAATAGLTAGMADALPSAKCHRWVFYMTQLSTHGILI